MRLTVLFFFIFFLQISAAAQENHYVDSLKAALSSASDDSSKMKVYLALTWEYQWSKPDSCIVYSQAGIKLAKELDLKKDEIELTLTMGEALAMKGNYEKALESKLGALRIAEEIRNTEKITNSLTGIGSVYYYSGDYSNALSYYKKANATGHLFGGNPEFMLGFMGECYFHLNQLDSAEYYIDQAYKADLKNFGNWTIPYFFKGDILAKRGNYNKALSFYHTALSFKIPKLDSILGYIGMATIFRQAGNQDSAIYYARVALEQGLRYSFSNKVIEASSILKDIYKERHLTDSAFKYLEVMLIAKDSLFSQEKIKLVQNLSFNERVRQQELKAADIKYKNRVRTTILFTVLGLVLLIGLLLWRNNRQKQKAYVLLQKQKQETDQQKGKVELAFTKLKETQSQLIQSEKMASLGELTAGIAHEIQNPLNFVNNFSEVNKELLVEMNEEIDKGNLADAKAIAMDIIDNEEKINHHGKRADSIVKGMLQHSRSSSGQKEPTDINLLADEYLRLSYHGLRAKDKTFNATLQTDFDQTIGKIEIVPQDIGRVLLNLYNNAFYTVSEKKAAASGNYEPVVFVRTQKKPDSVEIRVRDNGNGIPQNLADKIYQPFFTTKPTGQGTGLGLSLSYDIIKAHGGELKVETKEGEFAEFIIHLPLI